MRAEHSCPARITPTQERGARRGADRLWNIEVVELAALRRQRFYVGSRVWRIAKRVKVRIAGIIEKDDDDVWLLTTRLAGSEGRRPADRRCPEKISAIHKLVRSLYQCSFSPSWICRFGAAVVVIWPVCGRPRLVSGIPSW